MELVKELYRGWSQWCYTCNGGENEYGNSMENLGGGEIGLWWEESSGIGEVVF